MLIKVDDKNLVAGLEWHVIVNNNSSVNKLVRQKKGVWFWHASQAFYYGYVPKSTKISRKDTVIYSTAIAFAKSQPNSNALGVIKIPDSHQYLICGVYQNRPKEGYDCVVNSPEEVSRVIKNFDKLCGEAGYALLGDIEYGEMQTFTLQNLVSTISDTSKLLKVKSEIINPVTILIGVVILAFLANEGWKQYVVYRNKQIATKLAQKQKSSQQLYDEAIAEKRNEVALLVAEAPSIRRALSLLPPNIGGWKTKTVKCTARNDKKLDCVLTFIRGDSGSINNKSFVQYAAPYKFQSVKFMPNLNSIEAELVIDGLAFTTIGTAIDASVSMKNEMIDFGSLVQHLMPFGAPNFSQFAPIQLRNDAQNGQISSLPPLSAKWTQTGPFRILELMNNFPKYAVLNSINLTVSDTPKYELKTSFLTIEIDATVFAKPN